MRTIVDSTSITKDPGSDSDPGSNIDVTVKNEEEEEEAMDGWNGNSQGECNWHTIYLNLTGCMEYVFYRCFYPILQSLQVSWH